jgi:hypothetical protein
MKVLIMRLEGGRIPGHNMTLLVEQPAEFDADCPGPLIFAFLVHLLKATSLQNGKVQFDGYLSLMVKKLGTANNRGDQSRCVRNS